MRPTYEQWKQQKGDKVKTMSDPIQAYVRDTTPEALLAKRLNEIFPKKDHPNLEKISPLKSGVHFLVWFYGIAYILIFIAAQG